MNTFQINCFLEAAKRLNFSTAASNLFISQPTISRNISLLEKELEFPLFIRSNFQGIQLTDAGKYMVDAFSQSQNIINEAINQARIINENKIHHLSIGLLEGQMVDDKLCSLLNEFKEVQANLELEIFRESFHVLISKVHTGELDVVTTLDWEFLDQDELIVNKMYTLPTLLIVPKKVLPVPEKDRIYSLSDFSTIPFIAVNENDSLESINLLYEACDVAGFKPIIKFVNNLKEETILLEMGKGIAGLNPFHTICHSPNVNCIPIKEFTPQWFSIAWKNKSSNPTVSIFDTFFNDWRNNRKQL